MARPTLAQLGVPTVFSGVCVHGTPASEGDAFQDPAQAREFINYLWNHGVGGIKTFGSTTKQEVAHQAVLRGMLAIHRWWRGHRIGANDYCTPDAEIVQYVNVGCKIQELHNEPNLAEEWEDGPYHGLPPYDQIPNILWTDWLKFADNCNRVGAYAMFPALSPGGNWDHRQMLDAMLNWGIQHNYMGRVQDNVVAQHPRGHNFDRDVPYSPTMTCTWDEYRRNILKFKEAGADTWHIASEWGWSLGNQADPARPRVDLPFWYEQNRETWMRMNPNSDKPVEPEMLALCYWVQGDPTGWPQDSIDQGRLDMPSPSPLWIDMEQHPEWYRWNRYESDPPVEDDVLVFDMYGNEQNWEWIESNYGDVQIIEPDGEHFAVTQLNEVEGIMGFTCTLLNEFGGPVAGQQVAYIWPDGEQIEVTNANGVADHTAGQGEGYWYPGPGPISWEVRGQPSDLIGGLGWLLDSNHKHLQVTMQWTGGDEPPPPDDNWETLFDKLDQIIALLQP